MPPYNDDYLEWLAAAPKGVRWDKAQEMYALYQERRKEQAEAVARRLLGKQSNCDRNMHVPQAQYSQHTICDSCFIEVKYNLGTGTWREIDDN